MFRRTKIVATLGPATDEAHHLYDIIEAGVNIVRLNFSHGDREDHVRRAQMVRKIAKELKVNVAVLGDLQGPKIRIAKFKNGSALLKEKQPFILDTASDANAGDEHQVKVDYENLPQDLKPNDVLWLDDGKIQLHVEKIEDTKIYTQVMLGGTLSNKKGINKRGGGLSADALTEKDKEDIKTAAQINVDYLAVSFPRNGQDIQYARELAQKAGSDAQIIAKVERAEAVASEKAIRDIIHASDAIMIARGDLGVEIGDPELVAVQKRLIQLCKELNSPVITATQMMESMISSSMPTRAEVMDVANAVLDGTDAVMLSAETASGAYPKETVQAMAEVCLGAERHPQAQLQSNTNHLAQNFHYAEEATAFCAMHIANHLRDVKAIVTLTESGKTALIMSRISSTLPIFALSPHKKTLATMALFRGVQPLSMSAEKMSSDIAQSTLEVLQKETYLKKGDQIVLTFGDNMHAVGSTNTCKIVTL